MHHTLEIHEILLNIFDQCCSCDLPALARTCRAFKEPALDALWEGLDDLSPLVECLPEASYQPTRAGEYSFSRPLTQTEWDILLSYTRRVRSIEDFNSEPDEKSLKILSNPPTTALLFPNLRTLRCDYTKKTMPLLHLPLPSLLSLDVEFDNLRLFQNSLQSFPKLSPNIRELCIHVYPRKATVGEIGGDYICRWKNLRSVFCPRVALDVDALVHLSRMPALTRLSFMTSTILPVSDTPLFFSNLHDLTLHSESLHLISRLLSQIQLPAITKFTAFVFHSPSRQDLTSFFTCVQTSSADRTIKCLSLNQFSPLSDNAVRSEAPLLSLEDLRPCMALRNIRELRLNIEWNVGLTDSELLTLASTWPHLEDLFINVNWGWNTLCGITPNGLLQLLQTCRSLSRICLAIDTRGYVELPPHGSLAGLGLTLPPSAYINVLDSIIEAESVPAVAAFFARIAPAPNFTLRAWGSWDMAKRPGREVYKDRWDEVYRRANVLVSLIPGGDTVIELQRTLAEVITRSDGST
ncbi:hypothetical protein OG21DRAFT_1449763 [Imleria badia]|nr:hypothetical protein OG21DRAFT_1449763 [Imleria badia]